MSSAKRLFRLGLNVLTAGELVSSWRSEITFDQTFKNALIKGFVYMFKSNMFYS